MLQGCYSASKARCATPGWNCVTSPPNQLESHGWNVALAWQSRATESLFCIWRCMLHNRCRGELSGSRQKVQPVPPSEMLLSASISLVYITSKPFPTKLCGSLHGAVAINQRATGLRQVLLLLSSRPPPPSLLLQHRWASNRTDSTEAHSYSYRRQHGGWLVFELVCRSRPCSSSLVDSPGTAVYNMQQIVEYSNTRLLMRFKTSLQQHMPCMSNCTLRSDTSAALHCPYFHLLQVQHPPAQQQLVPQSKHLLYPVILSLIWPTCFVREGGL
jgi:hypothetical protein